MAVTTKNIRSVHRARTVTFDQRVRTIWYGTTLIVAAVTAYIAISLAMAKIQIVFDDLRYGRPRTTHMEGFVGHEASSQLPTHFMAINLNRQIVVLELPGGDAQNLRTLQGPYLFGADEDLTTVTLHLNDMDDDGQPDLVLDIRNEQLVYLNKDGAFRLPTDKEQLQLNTGRAP